MNETEARVYADALRKTGKYRDVRVVAAPIGARSRVIAIAIVRPLDAMSTYLYDEQKVLDELAAARQETAT